jgi:hypothetical protein
MRGAMTMVREVGSPINTSVRDSDRRGEFRADRGGHIGRHSAGKGWTPLARRDQGDLSLERSNLDFPLDGDNSLKR